MNRIILIVLILNGLSLYANDDSLTIADLKRELMPIKASIHKMNIANSELKSEIINLNVKIMAAVDTIEALQSKIDSNANTILETANQLGLQITETKQIATKRIDEVDQSLSKNSLYGIIGVLIAILLSIMIYWLLSKRQKSDKTDIIEQLSYTKSSIEESLVNQFGKQTELMETQLQYLEQQNNNTPATTNQEPDHSLALKVASEINLIERNINLMDAGTKGLKQLVRSVAKLKDNLAANGYEMPELIGKQFHQGMKVIVTSSIPDENLEKGREIISKVLIPQVNFNDKMIQTAQIEVSVGI